MRVSVLLLLLFASCIASADQATDTKSANQNDSSNVIKPLSNKEILDTIKSSIKAQLPPAKDLSDEVVIKYDAPQVNLSTSLGDPKLASDLNLVVSDKNVDYDEFSEITKKAYKASIVGQSEAALTLYKRAYKMQPQNTNIIFALGSLYQKLKQYDEARNMYKILFALEPDNYKAINNYIALIAESSPDQAIQQLHEIESNNPSYSPIQAQLGMIFAKLGDYEQAETHLRKAITLSPEVTSYRYNLAVLYDKAGAYEAAIKLYKQIFLSYQNGDSIPQNPEQINNRIQYLQSMINKKKSEGAIESGNG